MEEVLIVLCVVMLFKFVVFLLLEKERQLTEIS